MPENETTLYQGQNFEIGHGPGFYGIWPAGAPRPPSIEWWPDTPEGWNGAWTRFTRLEGPAPGARGAPTAPAGQDTPGSAGQRLAAAAAGTSPRAVIAASLLAAGVVCGIAGLLPATCPA